VVVHKAPGQPVAGKRCVSRLTSARRLTRPAGKLFNREVVIVEADASTGDAVKLMHDCHVGDLAGVERRTAY